MGVGAQVHDYLVQLSGIRQHQAAIGIDLALDLDGGGQRGTDQVQGLLDQLVDLHRLLLLVAVVAKGEDLAYHLPGTSGSGVDLR